MAPIKRAWQRLTQKVPPGDAQKELEAKYLHFQRLLSANNQVLSLMADMEEKLSGDYLFDFQYIRSTVSQVCGETEALVAALNGMGGGAYGDLIGAFSRIKQEVEAVLHHRREIPVAPLVLSLDQVDATMAEVVGGKNANLGEVKARVGLPAPNGFAVSTYAYKVFLDYNSLTERITQLLGRWSLDDLDSLAQVSDDLKEMIHGARVPPELEDALLEAYEKLCRQEQGRPLLAVRSSAVGEDLTLTFAGQYATYLNVPPEDLTRRYQDIVASLFTPRALFYYKNKGFKEEEMAMGIGVMPMIGARASGVLFTRRPDEADSNAVLINAVWGLGKYAVSGTINPDYYLVAYEPPGLVLEQSIPPKQVMLKSRPQGGVEEAPVPRELVEAPCLKPKHLARLLNWAQILEDHYQHPQDVEWALDEDEKLWLLQTRPLKLPPRKPAERPVRTLKSHKVLLDQGTVACRGVGAGPVVMVRKEEDLRNFPQGGVLVARHTSPKYVTVMPQAAAIITDAGSPTGHMALLAREFQIPTIINTGVATKVLQPGQEVTVDANYNNIYEGVIPEILESGDIKRNDLADSPVFQTLKAVVKKVVPLNLINPRDESFSPENCRTIHDLVRYGHEFSMREMFRLTETEGQAGGEVVDLDTDLPLKIRILDLGGGLKAGWRRKVRPPQIESLPFKAFWQGLAAMRWPQAKPQGVRSLASVFASTPEEAAQGAATWSDQSYVVLSRNYMNFSIRLGYHLSTVEAYVCDQINDNYLTFSFRGGGSTPERRERRVRLIEEIIDHLHLAYQRKGDLIEARLAKYSPEKMLQRLEWLGKLTLYTKQLDMVMFSDGIVDWYIKDFLREHVEVSF
ncbi:MAG: phosphoenolpyruvate synthase [Deltaproteobacteria bacterium]|nr:phosphoenolpyruvate synthase [Deltaproteobacteria bacterium]